jgi:1-phosphofructokinase family hexose kinase
VIYTLTLNPAIDRELQVPAIAFGEVLRASAHRVDVGGKGFNVSRALRALDTDSVALGFVGGHAGEMIAEGLSRLGIGTDFVRITGGETRTNVSVVAPYRHLKVNEAGAAVTREEELRLVEKIRTLARAGDWWVLSGSLPPGASTGVYAEVIRIVNAAGGRALLDTSGPALAAGCAAGPYLAKPNAAEAGELTGLPVETTEQVHVAALAVHRTGVINVLVSLGRRGALLSDGAGAWLAASPAVEERNPVGAGDSMVAGLVWGLSRAMRLEEALRWAVASGAAAASLAGTAFGSTAMVQELVKRVQVGSLGAQAARHGGAHAV